MIRSLTQLFGGFQAMLGRVVTAKGDLLVHSGTLPTRLGAGTNGQGLAYDNGSAVGLKAVDRPPGLLLPPWFVPEATIAGNVLITQKSLVLPWAVTISAVQCVGCDGLDTTATGDLVLRFSDADYTGAGATWTLDLTVSHGAVFVRQMGGGVIAAGGRLYGFVVQALGGHQGVHVMVEFS